MKITSARSLGQVIVVIVLAVTSPSGHATSSDVETGTRAEAADPLLDAAVNYLTTLYAEDFERLKTLMTEEAQFDDPTATALLGREYLFSGRELILDNFAAAASGSRDDGFEVVSSFTSGDRAVLTVTYHSVIDGDWFGRPGLWIPIRVSAVTILRFVDGKVAEHLDHVDYDELVRQVRAFDGDAERP